MIKIQKDKFGYMISKNKFWIKKIVNRYKQGRPFGTRTLAANKSCMDKEIGKE